MGGLFIRIICNWLPEHLTNLRDIFAKFAEVDYVQYDIEQLKKNICLYDAFFCSVSIYLDNEFYDFAKKLKVIVTPSTGTDHINIYEAEKRNIDVISIKNDIDLLENITSTAELALGLMISTARMIPAAFGSVKSGQWSSSLFRGHMLSGKTLGIIGFGRLGKMMASYGHALKMKILAADPYKSINKEYIQKVTLEYLLENSDFISLHVHLNDETAGMIGKRQLKMMKSGAVIINTSRGAIIDEAALLEALKEGHLGGAGIDVLTSELFEDTKTIPLVKYAEKHANVVITPHVGGVTFEAQQLAYERAARKLNEWYLENYKKKYNKTLNYGAIVNEE